MRAYPHDFPRTTTMRTSRTPALRLPLGATALVAAISLGCWASLAHAIALL